MPGHNSEERLTKLEAENVRLKERIQSWGREIPSDLTTKWLAMMADTKQQCRGDGMPNPFSALTSVEATVWWWENVEKPRLLEATK